MLTIDAREPYACQWQPDLIKAPRVLLEYFIEILHIRLSKISFGGGRRREQPRCSSCLPH